MSIVIKYRLDTSRTKMAVINLLSLFILMFVSSIDPRKVLTKSRNREIIKEKIFCFFSLALFSFRVFCFDPMPKQVDKI